MVISSLVEQKMIFDHPPCILSMDPGPPDLSILDESTPILLPWDFKIVRVSTFSGWVECGKVRFAIAFIVHLFEGGWFLKEPFGGGGDSYWLEVLLLLLRTTSWRCVAQLISDLHRWGYSWESSWDGCHADYNVLDVVWVSWCGQDLDVSVSLSSRDGGEKRLHHRTQSSCQWPDIALSIEVRVLIL